MFFKDFKIVEAKQLRPGAIIVHRNDLALLVSVRQVALTIRLNLLIRGALLEVRCNPFERCVVHRDEAGVKNAASKV